MDNTYYKDKKLSDPKQTELTTKVLRAKHSNIADKALLLNNGIEKVQL